MIKEVYYWHYGLESSGPYDTWEAAMKDFRYEKEARGWTVAAPRISTMYVKVERLIAEEGIG